MTHLSTSQFQNDMEGTLRRVAAEGDRIVLRHHRKNVAALVSIEDLELLRSLEDLHDLDIARAASAKARKEGIVPWEQAKKELAL